MKPDKIIIYLENTESIEIDKENIEIVFMANIGKGLMFHPKHNVYDVQETAELTVIKLNSSVKRLDHKSITTPFGDTGETYGVVERLKMHSDIVFIDFVGEGVANRYFVDWAGTEYTNDRQTVHETDNGLMIIIAGEETRKMNESLLRSLDD